VKRLDARTHYAVKFGEAPRRVVGRRRSGRLPS